MRYYINSRGNKGDDEARKRHPPEANLALSRRQSFPFDSRVSREKSIAGERVVGSGMNAKSVLTSWPLSLSLSLCASRHSYSSRRDTKVIRPA